MKPSPHPKEVGGINIDERQPWRTENLGRLLLHAFNLCEQRVLDRLHAKGFGDTRHVHLNVMRHVDREGTRMSDLATRLGITNGAMTQAVDLCVDEKMLKLSTDDTDRRVRRVRITARGKRYLEVVHSTYDSIDGDVRELLGRSGAANLRTALLRIRETNLTPKKH